MGIVCLHFSYKSKASRTYFEITNEHELQAYIHNKTQETLTSLSFKKFGQFFLPSDIDEDTVCSTCPQAVDGFLFERNMGMTDDQLEDQVEYFCEILEIGDERVCAGLVALNGPIFFYILDNVPQLSAHEVCSLILERHSCPNATNIDWTIDVPSGTGDTKTPTGKTTIKIAQFSDLHYDPLYTPGKTNQCEEPLCCQNDQADATGDSDKCGYWGTYTSGDTPLATIESALKNGVSQDIDMVYVTGDIVSHRSWETSVEGNTKSISQIYDLFKQYFKDTPVYYILGNHEGHPYDTFSAEAVDPSDDLSSSWLYNLLLTKSVDLKPDDVKDTILKGGYYTATPREGLRLIVLNDNVCSIKNWWLLYDNYDQYGQLGWMVKVLQEAETNKESVHILLHIPTLECLKTWAREYNKIVARFANTIVAQFYGHTHRDEFYVYYDPSSSEPVNVGWNGASLMPDSSNPSYKIYEVDAETFQLVDFEEWTFNLTEANANPDKDLEWYKLYSFKDAYGITSFDSASIDALVVKMAENHDLIGDFYRYKFRDSDLMNSQDCNETCQKDILCTIVSSEFEETKRCQEVLAIYDQYNTNFQVEK